MERRNLSALCAGTAGYLAGRRSRTAGGDRRATETWFSSERARITGPWRGVATLALGRRMPLLAILSARARTGGAPAVAGALCLIANQIPGSRAHPTDANQQPT